MIRFYPFGPIEVQNAKVMGTRCLCGRYASASILSPGGVIAVLCAVCAERLEDEIRGHK